MDLVAGLLTVRRSSWKGHRGASRFSVVATLALLAPLSLLVMRR